MTNNPPSTRIYPGEYGYPLKLKARYDNFIGGDWVAPADGEYYQNLTPVTGQLLCEVASSGKKDIDLALDAAHKVKDKWAHTSVQDRAAILFKIADRMEQNLELLATAETWDNGKPIRETSAADVPLAIDHFRYFASCIRAQEGGISEVDSDTVAYHFHEPLGVVGQIIPWNFPLLMASWKMAPALAAGNCVVLKPARLTPLSVLLLMEVIGDLLPPGVVNVVNGAGGEIGEYLATSKRIAKVAFTGSTEVGQQIMQYATQNIIPVTLELGGKSPNIFFADVMDEEDAFFDKALEGFALFAFNQGEVCTCPSRALVQESIYERFMERAIRRVESIRSGNPLDSVTQMGAQVSHGQLETILNYIDIGKKEGADVLTGGRRKQLDGELKRDITSSRPFCTVRTICAYSRRRSLVRCWLSRPLKPWRKRWKSLTILSMDLVLASGAVTAIWHIRWGVVSRRGVYGPTAIMLTRHMRLSAAINNQALDARPTK